MGASAGLEESTKDLPRGRTRFVPYADTPLTGRVLYSCEEVIVSTLADFNGLPAAAAEAELIACCASPHWAREVAAQRPYTGVEAAVEASDVVLAALPWEQIALAIDAHPRIGERAGGPGREADWSRREQAGVDHADQDVLTALAAANRAYEERFGHVFLIFASGRSDAEMLAAARRRLGHDDETERATVRGELSKIVRLRLARLLSEPPASGEGARPA